MPNPKLCVDGVVMVQVEISSSFTEECQKNLREQFENDFGTEKSDPKWSIPNKIGKLDITSMESNFEQCHLCQA